MVEENIGQAGGVEPGSGAQARGVGRGAGGLLTHFQQEPQRFPDKAFICSSPFPFKLRVFNLQQWQALFFFFLGIQEKYKQHVQSEEWQQAWKLVI